MYAVFAEKFIRSFFVSSVEFCKLKLPYPTKTRITRPIWPSRPKGDTRTQGPPGPVNLFQYGQVPIMQVN